MDTLEIYDNEKRDLGSTLVLFYHENASAGEWHSYGHLPHLQDIEVQRTLCTFLFVLVTESSRQMTDESEQGGFMEVFKMERVSGSVLVACHLDSRRCRLFAILCGSVFMLGSIF